MSWITDRVHGLLRTRHSAGPAALEQIREWHPRFSDRTDEEIRQAPFTEEDARLVYAREHGFETWDDLTNRVNLLCSNPSAATTEPFMAAFAALQSGDHRRLSKLCSARNPRLASERGTNGNTLLNLAVSLAGRPDWKGGLSSIEALLAAGADVNDAQRSRLDAAPCGRLLQPTRDCSFADRKRRGPGCGSARRRRHSVDRRAVLGTSRSSRSAGPPLDGPEQPPRCRRAWHPAVWWMPASIPMALSLPRLAPREASIVRIAASRTGSPPPDPQEVLDEALVWACKSGRVEVLEQLVKAGARLDADPYRGTPLIWAAVCNRAETVTWLLDHGATINQKATFGGLTHGQGITALHMAAQNGHLPILKLLVENGADRSIKEDLYQSTAEGAAAYFGKSEARDYLRSSLD